MPEIAGKLTIKDGKNAGKHPSVASVYRALAEATDAERAAAAGPDSDAPRRPAPVRLHRPGDTLIAEDLQLRGRLVAQRATLAAADREKAR